MSDCLFGVSPVNYPDSDPEVYLIELNSDGLFALELPIFRDTRVKVRTTQNVVWCVSKKVLIRSVSMTKTCIVASHKKGHRQTEQTMIRRRRTRCLIRVYTVCLQEFLLKIE